MNYVRAVGKKIQIKKKFGCLVGVLSVVSYLYRHCVACLISLIWHHGALIIIFEEKTN